MEIPPPFLDSVVSKAQGYAFYLEITLFMPFLFLATKDSKIDRFTGNLSFSTYLLVHPIMHCNHGTENIHRVFTLIMTAPCN